MRKDQMKPLKDATIECNEKASQELLRETMTIIIDGKKCVVYRDDIEKMLYSHLSLNVLNYGA